MAASATETGAVDLDAYFDRIGFSGSPTPTLDTLAALHLAHPQAIPFENLDPFLGRPVALDLAPLTAKLVHGRRGGYCYEQNLLFKAVLETLGFKVDGLAARVLWGRPEGALTPRTHMLLRVEIDGTAWLADVGFGGLTQTAPLRIDTRREQKTPHEHFRVGEDSGYFTVRAKVSGEWRSLYRFDLSDHHAPDYAIANHYVSTHAASPFVTGLMAARALPDRRLALSGNRLTIHHLNGTNERHEFEEVEELGDAIEDIFGVAISDRVAFAEAVYAKAVISRAP